MTKRIVGASFILLAISVVLVTATVYELAQQTVGQTIVNVATLTLKNVALGTLEEGETRNYTKATVASLGNAVDITTTKADIYLHFNSDLDSLDAYYTTYTLVVRCITVPAGSSYAVGDVAATMTIAAPDPAPITLDVAGSWAFDFELSTTARTVSADQAISATIVVTAEST